MTTDAKQLTKPELLSEGVLIDILKIRCITLPNVKTLRKSDLVEMYRRVALPMPQRQYNSSKPLGRKLSELRLHRKIAVGADQESTLYKTVVFSQNKVSNTTNNAKLDWYDPNQETLPRKSCLKKPSATTNNSGENGHKRKCDDTKEISQQNEAKKHKSITWP